MRGALRRYVSAARKVLHRNRASHYTRPSASLYPHQWNWDSAFVAIGYSHYDTAWAMREVRSLFEAQWKNGMLPQIVFDRSSLGTYFPEPDFWQCERSPNAPVGMLTSGITMPPIHAFAVLKIYENAQDKRDVLPFLKWIYPKLMALHRYLYRERNPEGEGLVCIRHPWESGMDNSPGWDPILERIDLAAEGIPEYRRRDTERGVDAGMRPSKRAYDYFVYLVDLFRRARYDEKVITRECPFLVCDPLFNAILCASNEALGRIGDILGESADEPREWYALTARSLGARLFNGERGIFSAYDLRTGSLIDLDTASGFMPLFGGAASAAQADKIYEYLDSRSFCALQQGNCFTVPSYDTQKEGFQRENYWRGPVWLNINWMLLLGLRRYGFNQKADSLARDIIQLPIRFGFYEYYDSFDGRGYGSREFSWSAALFIDTVYENYLKAGKTRLVPGARKVLTREVVLNAGGAEPFRGDGVDISRQMMRAVRELRRKFYTSRGTVDYEAMRLSAEYENYKRIARALAHVDPSAMSDERQKLAFWINLYNTIVIDGIIATGIRSSVKEVAGFFSRIKYRVGRHLFSPDDIEHGILRANGRKPMRPWRHFGMLSPKRGLSLRTLDPRIHFALVCGSRSCAPIEFYDPDRISEELDAATRNFVNSSEVIVVPEEQRLLLSMIFKWYEPDFHDVGGVVEFISRYILDDDKLAFLSESGGSARIEYLYYDWNLNR